jgi:hypothetical protein
MSLLLLAAAARPLRRISFSAAVTAALRFGVQGFYVLQY